LRSGISIKVEENKAAIERAQRLFDCFVVMSNIAEEGESAGTETELLRADKEPHDVEKNLALLKDPLIVNRLKLNMSEPLEALGAIL
jgi:hypothetical protein